MSDSTPSDNFALDFIKANPDTALQTMMKLANEVNVLREYYEASEVLRVRGVANTTEDEWDRRESAIIDVIKLKGEPHV